MLVPRKLVNQKLKLSPAQSRRLIPGKKFIESSVVVSTLNRMREGGQPKIIGDWITSELLTVEELSEHMSNEFLEVTARDIWNWIRRTYPVPHFRLTKRVVLFDPRYVGDWATGILRSRREP